MRKPDSRWIDFITHEDNREHFQFLSVFIIMAFISGFMTVMNYFTGWRQALMVATLSFSLLNIINALLESVNNRKIQRIPRVLFAVETIVLFTFFVINGQPKGFSALWAALLPACGLLLYKGVIGSLISGVQFLILVFLFYVPAGQQLLRYEYSDVFMMRFPVLYAAFYVVGLFFELVRFLTQRELTATRDRYKQENFRIMQVLADEYGIVVSVDLESGRMDFYSGQSFVSSYIAGGLFYESMSDISDKFVSEDCREEVKAFFSKESILNGLKNESSSMLTFSAIINGEERYCQAKVVKVPEVNGDIRQIVVAFSDADAYVREQQRIQQDLLTQRAMAEKANKAKTDFLFNMSHDIRTPMNAIIGFTNIAMKEAESPEKSKNSLKKVLLSSNMLLSLINDILDMSRIESGKVSITEAPVDMEAIFENIQSVMANFATSKDINLDFDILSLRDRYIFADKPRVERILVNLISNAIKYTKESGRVHVQCEQIGGAQPGYGCYRFTVKDNGIGMSEDFQAQMFDAFAREESSTVSGVQGTGLGLTLAKKLTDIMGGSIGCESERGVGSTFTVTLPFRLQEEKSMVKESADTKSVSRFDVSGKRVLLVEDNGLNREITTYILEENGMNVESAADGSVAVNMVLEKGIDHYDFILMDIQMPVMNGYEAAERIRTMFPDSSIPIIALSANAFEEDKQKSFAVGMNDHVSKPINISELLMALSKFI